jgi:hypothetical protein
MDVVLINKKTNIYQKLPKDVVVPIFGDTVKIGNTNYIVNVNHYDFNTNTHYIFLKTLEEYINEY